MLPVSVWILKIDLKQAANDGSGGLQERKQENYHIFSLLQVVTKIVVYDGGNRELWPFFLFYMMETS